MLRVAHRLRPLLVLLAVLFVPVVGADAAFAASGSGPAGLPTALPTNGKATPTPAAAPAGAEDTDAQLKRAVGESLTKLGNLDPQQKKIFDEEVVPQYSFFVKDYSQVGNKVSVQVDVDAIKNYLGFSAAKNISSGTTQLLLYLKVDPHCPKCVEASADVHKMIQARVERRGFVALWITPEELVDAKPTELAEKRNAAGVLTVEMKPAPMDDVDSAHADEKRFINSCTLDVRSVLHHEDQSEIYDTDSFEQTTSKLLTQAFVELGTKAVASGVGLAATQEMQIQVSGFSNFASYTQLKTQIQTRLKDFGVVEERKISRGHAVFAVKSNHTLDEIKQALSSIQLSGAVMTTTGAHDQTIEMEMR
jgi:hypothetical protein